MKGKPDVVIMAELDWDGLYAQSHVMAAGFAKDGHRVYYFNRTLQRWPKWRHLMTRLRPSPSLGITEKAIIPDGITVINLWVGPPVRWMRWINRILINRKIKQYDIKNPILLTYVPTFNCIDLATQLKPAVLAYVCYHNFDADVVVKDLLISEKKIVNSAELLFADSQFLMNRLRKVSNGREVLPSPPGVHFANFKTAFRGDERVNPMKICFYGGAGEHLDIQLYNALCDQFEVYFIAVINPVIKSMLDKRIIISNPVRNEQLPALLKQMDILTILYKQSDYIDGVIPAKFFECIATGKPVLVSGLKEAAYYEEVVYDTQNNFEKALAIISNIKYTHNDDRINLQFKIGEKADFSNRYSFMKENILNSFENNNR